MLLSPTPLVMPGMPTGGNPILPLFYFFFIFPFFHFNFVTPTPHPHPTPTPPHHHLLTRSHPRRAQSAVLTAPPRGTVATAVGFCVLCFSFCINTGLYK